MIPTMKTTNKVQEYLDYFWEWNPQLWREARGKLKGKNIVITAVIAILTQFLIVISYLGKLPDASYQVQQKASELTYAVTPQHSRFCLGSKPYNTYEAPLCIQDLLNHWMINWQVFWFDLFVTLSVIGMALLLVLGTYLLVNNAIAEQQQGTLHLVRLSPQSVASILGGKILGVPILLYLFVALGLPLHTIAALKANIPLNLLITFDLAIIASCCFFYSLGLLLSFVVPKAITPWAISLAIASFLWFFTILNVHKYQFNTQTILDWLFLFNPNNLILYLGKVTGIPYHYFDYPDFSFLGNTSSKNEELEPIFFSNLLFYGQALWAKVAVGFGIIIANYGFWSYWLWQGLKRRFYNAENTVISKQQSYWITGYFTAIALGFSLQSVNEDFLFGNIVFLQFLFLLWCLGLTFALSPQNQTLQDWARYRHYTSKQGNILWKELLLGEKSPSLVAIAINVLITNLYVIPSFTIFPLHEKTTNVFWGLVISTGTILLCAALAQWILMGKSKYKKIFAAANVTAIMIAPLVIYSVVHLYTGAGYYTSKYEVPLWWLFTSFPAIAVNETTFSTIALTILGQWLAITFLSMQITQKLRQAGKSETYKMIG
jgi:hypothetical protein